MTIIIRWNELKDISCPLSPKGDGRPSGLIQETMRLNGTFPSVFMGEIYVLFREETPHHTVLKPTQVDLL